MSKGFFNLPPPPPPERVDHYTAKQVDILLNLYYRDQPRPTPYPAIAKAMGVPNNPDALERLRWGYITGYGGNDPKGPRKVYTPGDTRVGRVGWVWHPREDKDLRAAFEGDGLLRTPPVDLNYLAEVLARRPGEIEKRGYEMGIFKKRL